MSYGDEWDKREESRQNGLIKIKNAMSYTMIFLSGAFSGATAILLLGL